MKLLLVDDEPGIREGLAALLRRKGHEVITAGDCQRAVATLAGGDVDLVLTDWRLPDGRAAEFVGSCPCPVVAMSGHPEEVIGTPGIDHVLTKPVTPSQLLELVSEFGSRECSSGPELPRDVAELVHRCRQLLAADGELEDDGCFVALRLPLADDDLLTEVAELGGDQRVLQTTAGAVIELRWCRDGRPDVGVPVVAPESSWPETEEFAVDFHGQDLPPARFAACLDRVGRQAACGRRVHFLNVPDSLLSWTSDQGRTDDMPMRAAVGPRLPAVLADLWS